MNSNKRRSALICVHLRLNNTSLRSPAEDGGMAVVADHFDPG